LVAAPALLAPTKSERIASTKLACGFTAAIIHIKGVEYNPRETTVLSLLASPRMKRLTGLLAATAVAALGGVAPAGAETINVTNGADSGAGSLRAALAAAKEGDTVVVPALTVSLTSGQLLIDKSLTLVGAGARSTVLSGGNHVRVLDVEKGTASISGVTISGGDGKVTSVSGEADGGGLLVESGAAVTLADSTVTGNVINEQEGGGVYDEGTMTILRSTISFNEAHAENRAGGIKVAISSPHTFTLADSTVAHNAIEPGGLGAGIYVNAGGAGLTFTDDTFDFDTAGGTGSVFDLNGGGSPTTITNTIILGGGEKSCSRMPASPSGGGNIEDQSLCNFTHAGDQQKVDPHLGPLQDNGGSTDTQLPAAGSVALDAGVDGACAATDQRGAPRPQGAHCDSGAVERTTPLAGAPGIASVTTSGAAITAVVNPFFIGGTFVYNYGQTTAYGSSTPVVQLLDGLGAQTAATSLAGLAPATTYHVQLVVSTPDGTASSSDATFTTLSLPVVPTPIITAASLSNRRFRVAAQPTALSAEKAPLGTSFRFTLSAQAQVRIVITHAAPGLRSGHSCLAPSRRLRRKHAKRCTRTITDGTIARVNQAQGADKIPFSGRLGHKALRVGAYKAVLRATNAGGTSKPVALSFRVVR
jgi:hypothetical protein